MFKMEFKVYLRKINYNLAKDNNILKLKNNYYRKRSLLLDNLNKKIFYIKFKKKILNFCQISNYSFF